MAVSNIDAIKDAIARLPENDRALLAHWMNASIVREQLLAADDQISRGEGSEFDQETLADLFAETRASALDLLRERNGKRSG
jgi:hypothetical protein